MVNNDRLDLEKDKDIQKVIDLDVEPIIFSDYISKMTRWNTKTERILVLTTVNIYNFKGKK